MESEIIFLELYYVDNYEEDQTKTRLTLKSRYRLNTHNVGFRNPAERPSTSFFFNQTQYHCYVRVVTNTLEIIWKALIYNEELQAITSDYIEHKGDVAFANDTGVIRFTCDKFGDDIVGFKVFFTLLKE